MKLLNIVMLTLAFIFLSACQADIEDGGPCQYKKLDDPAVVKIVSETRVVLEGIEMYEVPASDFETTPVEGEEYIVTALHITEGSCNPLSVRSVRKP